MFANEISGITCITAKNAKDGTKSTKDYTAKDSNNELKRGCLFLDTLFLKLFYSHPGF